MSERRIAQRIPNSDPAYEYKYIPIAPIYTAPSSRVLLIGTQSDTAKPYWFLGARVSQFLYVSPSMTSNLILGVQASEIKRVGLNRLTLIKFEDHAIYPYSLQLEIPYWLEDIYVEVWEYLGVEPELNLESALNNIQISLDTIEQSIQSLGSGNSNSDWGT